MKRRLNSVKIIFVLIVCAGALIFWRLYPSHSISKVSKSSNINIQNPLNFTNELDFNCVNAKLIETQFPMCTYSAAEDSFVSAAILTGGYWERVMAENLVKFFKDRTNFTFLDIGANIGIYSLPIAHLGRHVIAVEPNWDTVRRLAKSVSLGGIASRIDILYHAIGDKRSTTTLKFNRVNRGATVLLNNVTCLDGCELLKHPVSVVVLDDLIPIMRYRKAVIKVDAEGSEINIFTEASASAFFREIDVVVIQMEWVFYTLYFTGSPMQHQLVEKFLQFFYQRNYLVYDAKVESRLAFDWTTWPEDVCFKRAAGIASPYNVSTAV